MDVGEGWAAVSAVGGKVGWGEAVGLGRSVGGADLVGGRVGVAVGVGVRLGVCIGVDLIASSEALAAGGWVAAAEVADTVLVIVPSRPAVSPVLLHQSVFQPTMSTTLAPSSRMMRAPASQ